MPINLKRILITTATNVAKTMYNAQANLANAQANLANVAKDAARYQTLYQQGAVSRQTMDSYNTQLEQAQASVAAQQALVDNARVNVGDTNIVAPFAGKVDTNCLAEGSYVTASSTVLTSISNSDPMRVKFSLAENDYLKLMQGNTSNSGRLTDITMIVFVISLIFVFLCLAALYESWSLPLSIIMAVPAAVLGCVGLQFLRGLQSDIYMQIGMIVLIGLSAKASILIVEYAKMNVDNGMHA